MVQIIENSLKEIDFLGRYKKISFDNQRESVEKIKINKIDILEIFNKLGFLNTKYISRDKYYEVDRTIIDGIINIGLNFYTRFEESDFVLNIDIPDELIPFNGPLGLVCQKLGNEKFVRRPCFCSIKNLSIIIDDCCQFI
jgi:hypothetical protein